MGPSKTCFRLIIATIYINYVSPDKKPLRNFVVLEIRWKIRNSSTKACVRFLIRKKTCRYESTVDGSIRLKM